VTQAVAAAAAQGDRSENAEYTYGKKRLREIDRRVRFLRKRLEGMVIVDAAARAAIRSGCSSAPGWSSSRGGERALPHRGPG
jgi:transcription elongation GreA/GreB family factor